MIINEVKGIVQFINQVLKGKIAVYVMSFFDYMLYLLAFDDNLERLSHVSSTTPFAQP